MEKQLSISSQKPAKLSKALLLLGISLGYFMVLLDTTVLSVALPAIRNDLGGGIDGLQWVVNAYTIVFAGLLLSMGSLSDKFGSKRVYLTGLVLFLTASVLSASTTSLSGLITCRAILGIGGAALMPSSLTIIAHAYPAPADRARALGIWAAVTGLAMAAGPIAGGILVDTLGWQSIFLLNVPLSIISLLLTIRLVDEIKGTPQHSVDPAGQITIITAISGLSFALMEGGSYGWYSPVILAAIGLALLATVLFTIVEAKVKAPMLPLGLFRNGNVSLGIVAGMAINIGLSGILFMIPLFFQQVRGLSAHTTGLALLPLTVPLAFNPIFTGRIVARIGARIPMTVGFCLTGLGTFLLVWMDAVTSYVLSLIGMLLIGFGVSFTMPSLMAAVIASVPKEQSGTASGALNSSRQLGATIGVAVIGSILSGSATFISGMHVSFIVLSVIMFGAAYLINRFH